MKRAYRVSDRKNSFDVIVVAISAKSAKSIVFNDVDIGEYRWIDLRVKWIKDAKVDNLDIGFVDDELLIRMLLEGEEKLTKDEAVCFEKLKFELIASLGDDIDLSEKSNIYKLSLAIAKTIAHEVHIMINKKVKENEIRR